MKILGFEHVSFHFNDGREVQGNYVYLHDDTANPQKVIGMKTERVFLSDAKANACSFIPKVGDSVNVYYNKYGKVESIVRVRTTS